MQGNGSSQSRHLLIDCVQTNKSNDWRILISPANYNYHAHSLVEKLLVGATPSNRLVEISILLLNSLVEKVLEFRLSGNGNIAEMRVFECSMIILLSYLYAGLVPMRKLDASFCN